MNDSYYWWGLEESTFKGVLYDSINTYFLHDHPYNNWKEFSEADPHMAYAHLTYVRFEALEQQFVDLRVIPQMLGVQDLPIKSIVKDINRYEWLKSIVDLTLFRFSSLRDICFHFVNEVLELKIKDHELNIKKLKSRLRDSHPNVLMSLKVLDSSGLPLREDRNERAHKGFCKLYTEDDDFFKTAAWMEKPGQVMEGYDLISVFNSARDKISSIVINEVETALKSCISLVNELYDYYRDHHDFLSKNSRSGVSGHFHDYHRKKK